jgi:hypothetical protein
VTTESCAEQSRSTAEENRHFNPAADRKVSAGTFARGTEAEHVSTLYEKSLPARSWLSVERCPKIRASDGDRHGSIGLEAEGTTLQGHLEPSGILSVSNEKITDGQ